MRNRLFAVFGLVVAIGCGAAWASRFPVFRLFFSWPDGGTWSNAIEQVEGLAVAALIAWVARDHIGAKLAAWWAKHHGPHAIAQQREALRQHEEAKRGQQG